jgi:TonB family protein
VRRIITLLAIITVTLGIVFSPSLTLPQESPPTWEVYYSPHGGCTDAIIRDLGKAKTSILVQAYFFTSSPVAKALLNAHKRGVKVEVILDKSQKTQKYSSADFLVNSGVRTYIDSAHPIAHNKVMIIDGEMVITGSFNFTKAAEDNAENLLVIRDKKLAELYAKNWNEHVQHSKVYIGKGEASRTKGHVVEAIPQPLSGLNKYFSLIWAKVKEKWAIPENLKKEMVGLDTVIVVRIDRDGKVQKLWYEKRSGNSSYDQMAWEVINNATPFPAIPDEVKESPLEFGIHFSPK